MCTRVTCRRCGKPDWVGCGRHVEQVLGDVPPEERCRCREEADVPVAPTGQPWWKIW